jgi:hypothetical protein
MPGTVVVVSADTMGRGDDALGAKLLSARSRRSPSEPDAGHEGRSA